MSLGDSLRESQEERDGWRPATGLYDGTPCEVCHRPRVYVCKNGKRKCEKCDTVQTEPSQ